MEKNIYIKSKIQILLIMSIFFIPFVLTTKLYMWLNPIGFNEQIITIIVCPIVFMFIGFVYFIIVTIMANKYNI